MTEFSFNCVSCGNRTFTVDVASIGMHEATPIATFVCPDCGEYNAVQERPGGGLMVAVDTSAKSANTKSPGSG